MDFDDEQRQIDSIQRMLKEAKESAALGPSDTAVIELKGILIRKVEFLEAAMMTPQAGTLWKALTTIGWACLLGVLCSSALAEKRSHFEEAGQLTPDQAALVQKAIGQEKILIKAIQQRTPLVETYIQDTKPDAKLGQVPVTDEYTLSRVDFGKKGFFDKTFESREDPGKKGWFKGSFAAIEGLTKALRLRSTYNLTGFMQMMFLDPTGFDQQHYAFSFVRREFLGSVRTWVYDMHPKVSGMGRFYGRVWIEDQGGNVVRFKGTYTEPRAEDDSHYYLHFDSWRMNVQPGIWLPVAIYVEESSRDAGRQTGLKAQTHFWGYNLKLPTRDSESVSMTVADAEDKSDDTQDVSPLQASRQWVAQAENNVLDRLEQAGLLALPTPKGFELAVLDQIVTNLVVPNNIPLPVQVHCRIILTDTIEATTVGNTILISKGLIDTMPRNEATIASVIAMELAHITMGHHIETRYAFDDRLMFPDESSFRRVNMNHNDHDNQEAAQKAQQYMEASMYRDQMPTAGLFWAQLADRGQALKALNTPKLGDSLLKPDGTPWMATLARSAPRINWDDLTQIPALPLGSWLKTDPWDDSVHEMNTRLYAPLNAREKMPLEVTPVYYRLRRYDEEVVRLSQPGQPASASPASESNGTDESSRGTPSKEDPKRAETPGPEGGIPRERPQPDNRPQLEN
jgi:hypothetical protein